MLENYFTVEYEITIITIDLGFNLNKIVLANDFQLT
jgi:hypothetical protein